MTYSLRRTAFRQFTRVAPNRIPVPKTGDLFERTFQTSMGPVGLLAEVEVRGKTLHRKDVPDRVVIAFYAKLWLYGIGVVPRGFAELWRISEVCKRGCVVRLTD